MNGNKPGWRPSGSSLGYPPLYPNGAYKGRRKLDLFSAPGVSHRLQGSFGEHGKVSRGFHTNG